MSLAELRRSYWWASHYVDSLYKRVGAEAVVSEYHTRTPFAQSAFKDPFWMGHPIGCGVVKEFFECAKKMNWHAFSKIHNTWQYVHNATRDLSIVAKIGFEDTEPDWIVINPLGMKIFQPWGDPWPFHDQDCDEPTIFVEYTRNQIKNGSFTFRKFLSEKVEEDEPLGWHLHPSDGGKCHMFKRHVSFSKLYEPLHGPYGIRVYTEAEYTGTVLFSTDYIPVHAGQTYIISLDYAGTFKSSPSVEMFWYDEDYQLIDGKVLGNIPAGDYWKKHAPADLPDWRSITFTETIPSGAAYLLIRPMYGTLVKGDDRLFDMVWLSECIIKYPSEQPINVSPYYTFTAQLEGYGGERKANIYFNGTQIWSNVSATNVPRNIFETQISLDGIPSFRSAIRHSVQNNVFYYKYSSMRSDWQDRANKLQAWRDKYGFTYDIYHPLWRETSGYPDNYMVTWESVHDCDVWFTEPRTSTFYPYWSKMCQCRFASNVGVCGYILAPWFSGLTGMHMLDKYGDPYKQIVLGIPEGCLIPVTLNAYNSLIRLIGPTIPPPPLNTVKGYQINVPAIPELFAPFATASSLAFLAEIGYGFGDVLEAHGDGTTAQEARDWADNLASTLLTQQWGYPFESRKTGFYRHEDFGEINIPEFAGGFGTLIIYKDTEPYATSRTEFFAKFADIVSMPPETPGIIAVNQEATFCALRALQIYEWYKYKGGKGVFPKLLMPADVDGDGYVSELDVAKVQFCIDNGIYDMLCDINADGVIDNKDLDLVKANLGRGTPIPIKGVMWTPTISDEVQIEVT